ncbi:MAG TPA: prolyl aminopeptidase [Micavibrio sp.]|nr:prolyl aminopeptidase [Micavibrio sp.]
MAQPYDIKMPPGAAGYGYRRTPLLDFFPERTPYSSAFLPVGNGHEIYWEQSGNPDGVPILLLHGGPGGGTSPVQRRFFDPDHYRIILFDQRGAGRSSPFGSVEHNSRELLIGDIERLRKHLSVDQWHVFGGSWGSTLALSYAARYPERCLGLILSGIFLMEREEIEWFFYGIKSFFPEAWEQFAGHIPASERGDLLNAYYKRLFSSNLEAATEAAIHWCLYESACASLIPNYETITTPQQKSAVLSIARIECHYFKHEVIAPQDSLLKQVGRFRAIPSVIVNGRYDMLCPIRTAHKLHLAWPEADYVVVPDGGHSEQDPAIRSRLIEATENAKTLSKLT